MSSKASAGSARLPESPEDAETLYNELLKSFYDEVDFKQANQVASRLEQFLEASTDYSQSIRCEEVRSIIAELHDDLPRAIQCREAEIRKILELHERTVNTDAWDYVSARYSYRDVGDRLDLLAILYDRHGDLDRAIAILLESKAYCESHKVPFDGQDLLDEFEQSRTVKPQPPPAKRDEPAL